MLLKTDMPGSGNSKVRIPKEIMVELNNQHLPKDKGVKFFDYLLGLGFKPLTDKVNLKFSSRKTISRWGTVLIYRLKNVTNVNLYRHSVWVFIHELGHVFTNARPSHGNEFARCVENIYKHWLVFNK